MRRSALPLHRYVLRKPIKDGWGYFLPTWARKTGCPVKNEPLGTDYEAAVERAEKICRPRSRPQHQQRAHALQKVSEISRNHRMANAVGRKRSSNSAMKAVTSVLLIGRANR
jgi:hypothetical protein